MHDSEETNPPIPKKKKKTTRGEPTHLTRRPPGGEVVIIDEEESRAVLQSFFGAQGVALAARRNNFDQETLFSKVIQHVEDPDPKISLTASRQLWTMMKDVAQSQGIHGTRRVETEYTDEQGNRVTDRAEAKFLTDFERDRRARRERDAKVVLFGTDPREQQDQQGQSSAGGEPEPSGDEGDGSVVEPDTSSD